MAPDHPSRASVQETADTVRRIASEVNSRISQSEQDAKMVDLHARLGGRLVRVARGRYCVVVPTVCGTPPAVNPTLFSHIDARPRCYFRAVHALCLPATSLQRLVKAHRHLEMEESAVGFGTFTDKSVLHPKPGAAALCDSLGGHKQLQLFLLTDLLLIAKTSRGASHGGGGGAAWSAVRPCACCSAALTLAPVPACPTMQAC